MTGTYCDLTNISLYPHVLENGGSWVGVEKMMLIERRAVMLPTTPKKTRHLQKGSSRLARHVSHMGSREESHRSRSSCHLSSETYWPLTTIVINDFRIQHLTLNNDKMKNYAVKNLRKLRQNLCNAIFLVLTFCTPQIEKTRILEQILSSITELSYF